MNIPRHKNQCRIYFARSDDGRVKIGHSTNLKNRLKKLQYSDRVVIVKTIATMRVPYKCRMKRERDVQQYFGHRRISGEWFFLTDEEILTGIKLLKALEMKLVVAR